MSSYQLKLISKSDGQAYFIPSTGGIEAGFEYCDTGAIDFKYSIGGVNASKIVEDSTAIMFCDGAEMVNGRWHIQASEGDPYADEPYTRWVGKSMLNPLERVLVLGGPTEGADKTVDFNSVTVGAMLNTLFTMAQVRGAMVGYTWNFTAALDSNGVAWPGVLSRPLPIGANYANVLRAFVAQGAIEFCFVGMEIRVYGGKTMGVDRSGTVELIAGRDYTETPFRRSIEERAQFTLISGDDGSVQTASLDPSLNGPFGREEVSLTQSGTVDAALLGLVGATYLANNQNPREEFTRRCNLRDNGPVHGVTYRVGDKILDRSGTGATPYTVRSIILTIDENNDTGAAIVLNDKFIELEIRNQMWIDNLINGINAGGIPTVDTADKTTPSVPGGLTISSLAYLDSDGRPRSSPTFDWNPPTTNTDGSALVDLQDYEVQFKYSTEANWRTLRVTTDYAVLLNMDPGKTVQARVRAWDASAHASAFAGPVSHVLANDVTPPSQPAAPTATTARGTISVTHTFLKQGGGALEADTAFLELHYSQTSGFTPSSATYYDSFYQAGTIGFPNLPVNANPWYFKVIAVDRSGNRSVVSPQSTGLIMALVVSGDLAGPLNDEIDLAMSTATSAGTAASTAAGAAAAAQGDVDDLLANLNTNYYNKTSVDTLISTSASGKNKTVYSTSAASGTTGYADGDTWFQMSSLAAGGRAIAQWQFLGGTWLSRKVDGLVIANVDAASITTGFMDAARIQAGSLVIGQVNGLQPAIEASMTERTNLASNPAAVGTTSNTNGKAGWAPNWYGPAPAAGSTTLVTGAVDGPLPEVTTYIRKTWTTAGAGQNGDTGFGNTNDTTGALPVTANEVTTFSSYMRTNASGKRFRMRIKWMTAAGATIGAEVFSYPSAAETPIVAANTWTRVAYTGTAPATAAFARVWSDVADTGADAKWLVGDTLDGTALLIERGGTLGAYFDGNYASTTDRVYSWTGAVNASLSKATAAAVALAGQQSDAINTNPNFSDWVTGAYPAGWLAWGGSAGAPVRETTLERIPPYAARFNRGDTADYGMSIPASTSATSSLFPLPLNLDYVTITVEAMLVSGSSFSGSGVMLDWAGISGSSNLYRGGVHLGTEIPNPVNGKWYRVSKVVKKPGGTGTHTSWNAFLMANYGFIPTAVVTKTIKDVVFNRVAFRPSTSEEIAAYNAAPVSSVTDLDARIASKGTDLVVNGTGLLGNNTNFAANYDYVGSDAPTGASGSFYQKTSTQQTAMTDDLIPFDPAKKYRMSFQARQTVAGQVSRMYAAIAPYDAANNSIQPAHYMWMTGTLTTLAQALNPGDTIMKLTSAANWWGQTGKAAGASTHFRSAIFWNYVDPFGKAWPIESYSRNNTGSDFWLDGGVDLATGIVTLKVPYAGTARPIGTPVSNGSSGGSYMYMPTVQNVVVPETWTPYSDVYSAGIMASAGGVNGVAASWVQGAPPGTAKVKLVWLHNYPPIGGKQAIAAVSFSDASAAQATADAVTVLTNGWKFTGKTTINGGAVEADTISVAQLKAGSVGAKQLVVADTSNMAELNESQAGLVYYSGSTHVIETVAGVRWSKRDVTTNQYLMFRNQVGPIPFKTGDRVRVTFEAYADAAVTPNVQMWTYLGTSNPSSTFAVAPTPLGGSAWPSQITTTPQAFAFEGSVPAVGDQTAYLIGLSNIAGRDVRVRNVRAYLMGAGELIVDGTIEGRMVKAGSINADRINTATLVVGQSQVTNLVTDLAAKAKTLTGITDTTPVSGMAAGDLYVNTTNGRQWVYSGSVWVAIADPTKSKTIVGTTDTTPVSGMATGDIYLNSTNGRQWVYSGSAWVSITDASKSKATVGTTDTTPASGMVAGDTYSNSANGKTWVYSGSVWVAVADPSKSKSFTGTNDTTPASGMVAGDVYTNTSSGKQWVYSGSAWVVTYDPTKSKTFTGTNDTTPASGMTAGDVYTNTSSGKTWVYSGSAWVPVADTTKSKAFVGTTDTTTGPTGMVAGDTYTNTANGRTWVYSGTAWVPVVDATKHKTTTGTTDTTPSSGMVAGDSYVNTSNGKQWVYSGAAWVLTVDSTKSKTITGTTDTTPSSGMVTGDIYINTTNGKQWIYGGAAWVAVADPTKAKVITGITDTTPVSGMASGDLYVNTTNGRQWIYTGAVWVATQDATKVATFTGTTDTPPGSGMKVGDLYLNTTSGKQQIYTAGGWVAVTDPTKTTMTAVDAAYGGTKTLVTSWMDPDLTSIKGGMLKTGSVQANAIAAHVIGADLLVVGGVTNLVPDGYGEYGVTIPGSLFDSVVGVGMQSTDLPPASGVAAAYLGPNSTSTKAATARWIDVQPGQEYLVEVWLKADIANSKISIEWRDQANALSAVFAPTNIAGDNYGSGSGYIINALTVPTTWTLYSAVATIATGVTKMKIGAVLFNHASGSAFTAVQQFAIRIRPRGTGRLVVDGTLEGKHMKINSIEADKIGTGTLDVTTTIYAGNPAGSHAEVTGQGFFAYALNPETGAPSLAVRMGTTDNDLLAITNTAGDTVGSISDIGIGAFAGVSSDSDPTVGGMPLIGLTGNTDIPVEYPADGADRDWTANPRGILESYSKGTVQWCSWLGSDASVGVATGANGWLKIWDVGFDMEAGRQYKFEVSPFLIQGSLAGMTVAFFVRATTDGSMPTENSPVFARCYASVPSSGFVSVQIAGRLINGGTFAQSQIRLLGMIYCLTASQTAKGTAGDYCTISLTDQGLTTVPQGRILNLVSAGGTGGTGTPPATAAPKPYVKTYSSNGWASYRSINAPLRGSSAGAGDTNSKVYQGYSSAGSYNGDQRGLWTFPSITGDVGAGTITKVEAYIYFAHWYNNSGGTASIKVHGYAAAGWPTGGLPTLTTPSPAVNSAGWPKPGGRWVRLPPSTYASFKSGTYKGFAIGPAGSTSTTFYGFANATALLRVSYTK